MKFKERCEDMRTKQDVVNFCMTFQDVYEDYPFRDNQWAVIRYKHNKKVFAWIFERNDYIWVNVKCDQERRDFWRNVFSSVVTAFHLNKQHWNSIILDGSIPNKDIQIMIGESYKLIKGKK